MRFSIYAFLALRRGKLHHWRSLARWRQHQLPTETLANWCRLRQHSTARIDVQTILPFRSMRTLGLVEVAKQSVRKARWCCRRYWSL